MQGVYFVTVDVSGLRDSLSEAVPLDITAEDVGEWLVNRGFRVGLGGWYATEGIMEQLSSQFILSRNPIHASNAHAVGTV